MNENNSEKEIGQILTHAINNKLKVLIKYLSLKNEITERLIGSVEYTDEFDKFGYYDEHIKAFCYLRNAERHFKIDRIISIRIVDDVYCDNWIKNNQQNTIQQDSIQQNTIKKDTIQQNNIQRNNTSYNASNNKNQKNCFIASYVYGIDSFEANVLRAWRDDCLSQSILGRLFVKSYYKVSPGLVFISSRFYFFDMIIKKILNIVIRCILRKI